MITIDSRGCGEGKTTSAIYPKLQKNRSTHQKTLIVVPSVKLQTQYDDYLTNPVEVVKVNSMEKASETDTKTVIAKIKIAMEDPQVYVIIITQAAFKLLDVSDARKSTWHLIIDEAFEPSRVIKYLRNKSNFDWARCLQQANTTAGNHIPVEFDEKYLDSWSKSDTVRMILDSHWFTYVTPEGYAGLMYDTNDYVEVYQELNPELVLGWMSVHIAAAAFETLPMADWLNRNGIAYQVTHPFVCRSLPIVLHLVKNFDWSKARATKYPDIANKFRDYVRNTCDDLGIDQVLTLRNNADMGVIENEERLTHNPHGRNDLIGMTAISIESALNPTPGYKNFLSEHFGIGQFKTDPAGISEKLYITRGFSSYLFYQSIMRTAARVRNNTQRVHVFVLDYKSAHALTTYFEPEDVIEIPLSDLERVKKPNGRPRINSEPMTPAERMKRAREKKKSLQDVTKLPISAIGTFVTADDAADSRTNEQKLADLLKTIRLGK
jgi:hypothetical protein